MEGQDERLVFTEEEYCRNYSESLAGDDSDDDLSVGLNGQPLKDSRNELHFHHVGEENLPRRRLDGSDAFENCRYNSTDDNGDVHMPKFGTMSWSKFTSLNLASMQGIYFADVEDAHKFYSYYSFVKGFSIRRNKNDKSRSDPTDYLHISENDIENDVRGRKVGVGSQNNVPVDSDYETRT